MAAPKRTITSIDPESGGAGLRKYMEAMRYATSFDLSSELQAELFVSLQSFAQRHACSVHVRRGAGHRLVATIRTPWGEARAINLYGIWCEVLEAKRLARLRKKMNEQRFSKAWSR